MRIRWVHLVSIALATGVAGCAVEVKAQNGAPAAPPAARPGPVADQPSQPAPPPPAAAKSIGCFRDQGDPTGTNGRDLNGFVVNNPGMTTEMCNETCASKGFQYAATQYATWCFCGASYGKSGPSTNCNMKCSGNPNETCGGAWANLVYQLR